MFNIQQFLEKYIFTKGAGFSPYPNIITMILCVVLIISMFTIFEKRDIGFHCIIGACISIFISGFFGCVYYYIVVPNKEHFGLLSIYTLHALYYIPMMTTLLMYLMYVIDLTGHDMARARLIVYPFHAYWILIFITSQLTHIGYWIGTDLTIHESYFLDVFTFCYIYYIFITEWILMSSKHIPLPRIKNCTAVVFSIFLAVDFLQSLFAVDTLVNPSMLIPLIYLVIVFRKNTFDKRDGTMDAETFEDVADLKLKRRCPFSVNCIQIDNLSLLYRKKEFIIDVQKFCKAMRYHDIIYRVRENRLVMIVKSCDVDLARTLLENLYEKYGENYKAVTVPVTGIIKTGQDLMFLMMQELDQTDDNTVRGSVPDERYEKIQEARLIARRVIKGIAEKKDMEDGHVRVFCQPIYSTKRHGVISAESLMRLYVPDYGFLFPSVFIPIAEQENCIHTLSLIIFNKVCQYLSDDPAVDIVTVNFSVQELVKKDFVSDIMDAVEKYGINPKRIGIEITESMMESNFKSLLSVTTALKDQGFSILIDDFGTGYSNLGRTLELPVTVVKFDRSLLLAAEKASGREIIYGLVHIFKKMGIQTLCEGVENEDEEIFCQNASLDYLQGYLYSRPIPIENLGKIRRQIEQDHPAA